MSMKCNDLLTCLFFLFVFVICCLHCCYNQELSLKKADGSPYFARHDGSTEYVFIFMLITLKLIWMFACCFGVMTVQRLHRFWTLQNSHLNFMCVAKCLINQRSIISNSSILSENVALVFAFVLEFFLAIFLTQSSVSILQMFIVLIVVIDLKADVQGLNFFQCKCKDLADICICMFKFCTILKVHTKVSDDLFWTDIIILIVYMMIRCYPSLKRMIENSWTLFFSPENVHFKIAKHEK